MKMKSLSVYIISIISFAIFLMLSQIIFNYIFQKEPYLYYGSFPIENKNLKFSKEIPDQAKAVLTLEGDIIKVYLPKNSNYFDIILKDIKVFLYDTSIKLNKIIKPYFIEKSNLKAPDIYNYYIKLVGMVLFSVLFISGRLYTVFDKKNFKLFLLHYYKDNLKRLLLFSVVIGSFVIITLLFFKNMNLLYSYIFLALGAIFVASIFKNVFLNFLVYIMFMILSIFWVDIKYTSITLLILIILNMVYNYISFFSDKTIKTKEEKKIE